LLHAAAERSLPQFLPQPLLWLYIVPIVIAGAIGSRHIHEIAPALLILFQELDFANAAAYLREWVAKPLLMVVFALLAGAAVAKSARPEKWLIPVIISMCVMAALVPVYVARSGMSLNQLASSEAREFLSPLGLHANELGRLYASAVALALFTWSDSGSRGLRLALLLALGLSLVALVLTFSRGGFVAMAVATVLYVLRRFSARTLIITCVAVGGALLFAPQAIYERLSAGQGAGIDAISAGRVNGLWLPLLPEVLHHPPGRGNRDAGGEPSAQRFPAGRARHGPDGAGTAVRLLRACVERTARDGEGSRHPRGAARILPGSGSGPRGHARFRLHRQQPDAAPRAGLPVARDRHDVRLSRAAVRRCGHRAGRVARRADVSSGTGAATAPAVPHRLGHRAISLGAANAIDYAIQFLLPVV